MASLKQQVAIMEPHFSPFLHIDSLGISILQPDHVASLHLESLLMLVVQFLMPRVCTQNLEAVAKAFSISFLLL